MHPTLNYNFTPKIIIFLTICLLSLKGFGQASDWQQKVEKKSTQRWTLQEWLSQKERNRWMDQWLALHTPTPYEFSLELQTLNYTIVSLDSLPQHRTVSGMFTAYATLVGLSFQNTNNASEGFIDNTGYFHLRLLGTADQGSHFTISVGQQTRTYNNSTASPRSQLLGQLDLTLYLNHHFGLQGLYRYYNPIKADATYGDLSDAYKSLTVFIDFAAVRVFGSAFNEQETSVLGGQTTQRQIQGASGGIRVYF